MGVNLGKKVTAVVNCYFSKNIAEIGNGTLAIVIIWETEDINNKIVSPLPPPPCILVIFYEHKKTSVARARQGRNAIK